MYVKSPKWWLYILSVNSPMLMIIIPQGSNNWLLVMTECPTNIVSRPQGKIGKAGSLIKPWLEWRARQVFFICNIYNITNIIYKISLTCSHQSMILEDFKSFKICRVKNVQKKKLLYKILSGSCLISLMNKKLKEN